MTIQDEETIPYILQQVCYNVPQNYSDGRNKMQNLYYNHNNHTQWSFWTPIILDNTLVQLQLYNNNILTSLAFYHQTRWGYDYVNWEEWWTRWSSSISGDKPSTHLVLWVSNWNMNSTSPECMSRCYKNILLDTVNCLGYIWCMFQKLDLFPKCQIYPETMDNVKHSICIMN
jgi:hypothetical protein